MPDPVGTPEPSEPSPSAAPSPCRRCGYDLAGIHLRHRVLTCPECGLKGRPRDVIRRPKAGPAWGKQALLMSGPSAASFALAALLLSLDPYRVWPRQLFVVVAAFGLFCAVLLPPLVAMSTIDRQRDPAVKSWRFIGVLGAGWGTNGLIALVILVIVSLVAGPG